MSKVYRLLLLEDEPLILMDLEFAAIDRGCEVHCASNAEQALDIIRELDNLDGAVLDVSLGRNRTCLPVARELTERGIPFILHSGDLDRHRENIRELPALLIAKPAAAEKVISAAIVCAQGEDPDTVRCAAQ